MTDWVEIRPSLKRFDKIQFVPLEEAYNYTGFRSVFSFSEEVKDRCVELGTSRGLTDADLKCDTLFLDFDSNSEAEDKAREWLNSHNTRYQEYHTGGRGAHFHVPISIPNDGISTSNIKGFVRNNFPGADLSIYKTSGIFRLPGTFHEKHPGKFKRLVNEHEGQILRLGQTQVDVPMPRIFSQESDIDSKQALLNALLTMAHEGKRNTRVFIVGCMAKAAGLAQFEAEDLALKYNMFQVSPPLDPREVLAAIRSSYYGVRRSF